MWDDGILEGKGEFSKFYGYEPWGLGGCYRGDVEVDDVVCCIRRAENMVGRVEEKMEKKREREG